MPSKRQRRVSVVGCWLSVAVAVAIAIAACSRPPCPINGVGVARSRADQVAIGIAIAMWSPTSIEWGTISWRSLYMRLSKHSSYTWQITAQMREILHTYIMCRVFGSWANMYLVAFHISVFLFFLGQHKAGLSDHWLTKINTTKCCNNLISSSKY